MNTTPLDVINDNKEQNAHKRESKTVEVIDLKQILDEVIGEDNGEESSSESEWEAEGGKLDQDTKMSNEFQEEEDKLKEHALKEITDNFSKTFSNIQGDPRMKEGILKEIEKVEIQKIIKNAKKRINYNQNKTNKQYNSQITGNLSKKRTSIQAGFSDCNPENKKRQFKAFDKEPPKKSVSIAETLILNFKNLNNEELKTKMEQAIDKVLRDDPVLFQTALENQVQVLTQQAIEYYDSKQQVKLSELLSSVSPMAAILLNIKITLVNTNMMEEGNTLSQTLLPYLNQCSDFSFLGDHTNFTVNRYIQSLVLNIKDANMEVGKGFMILGLRMNPSQLQGIINSKVNQQSLVEALIHLKFSEESALIISQNPKIFLWQQLLQFFQGKSERTVSDCIKILSKMDILKDPGDQMNSLLDVFAYRKLLVDMLLKSQSIKLSLSKLLIVLENLKRLNSETIQYCLDQDSLQWEHLAIQNLSKEDQGSSKITIQAIEDLFQKHTEKIDNPVNFQDLFEVSIDMSEEMEEYRHCQYQSAIAAIVASQNSKLQVVTMPTGSGKTWVQALLARYYCKIGKTVTVVEPNNLLKQQTIEKIGLVHFNTSVVSISDFYQYGSQSDVIIIDEYDSIMINNPYAYFNSAISGVWQLRGKHVIAFSATSAPEVQRLVNNCIDEPKVINFVSEYEVINGSSPIQDGDIKACGTVEKVMSALESDIEKNYDNKPVIIVFDTDQLEVITSIVKNQKYQYFIGVAPQTLAQVKDLEFGILMIHAQECRGVDVRFQKDAIVLITARVKTFQDYLQMLGRGSRTRNVCEGILYTDTTEKSNIVMQRLKKSNIALMQELEKMLRFLEQRSLNKLVIDAVVKEDENGRLVKSMNDLQKHMNAKQYSNLIKDVNFNRRQ